MPGVVSAWVCLHHVVCSPVEVFSLLLVEETINLVACCVPHEHVSG